MTEQTEQTRRPDRSPDRRGADSPVFVNRGGRNSPDSLADILERVLDKGIVIVGDIQVRLLDIELLTIKVRLMVASVDRAREMGINWWEGDPFVSSGARGSGDVPPPLENGRPPESLDRAPQQEPAQPPEEPEREESKTGDG